jgi:uncharacterized membrane protein
MTPENHPAEPRHIELPPRAGLLTRVRAYFLTGLVIAAPLAITVYLVWWFVHWIDSWVKPLIPTRYDPEQYLPFALPGIGVLVAFIIITLLGFLTANLLGRTLIAYGERMLGRMPLVRTIYGGLKQMFETMLSSSTTTFNQVVLIEYPRRDTWSIAFVATSAKGEVLEKLKDGDRPEDELMSVYVPTTPNPTSGYLLFAKRKEMIELDMTIEEAAKLVISAGLVSPKYHARVKSPADKARLVGSRASSD